MKIKKGKRKVTKLTNAKLCEQFYRKYETKYEEDVVKTNFFKSKGRRNADNRTTG